MSNLKTQTELEQPLHTQDLSNAQCTCNECIKIYEQVTLRDKGWVCRISKPYAEIAEWIATLSTDSVVVVAYEHEADDEVKRTHTHVLVYGWELGPSEKQTRKNHLTKLVGKIEKTDWSFKTEKIDPHFITYMSKGKLEPNYYTRITKETIDAYKVKWIDPAKKKLKLVNGKFIAEDKEDKKLTKWEMLQMMQSKIKEDTTMEQTLEIIRGVLKKNNQVIGFYKIMDYYDSIMLYNKPETIMQMAKTTIEKRLR